MAADTDRCPRCARAFRCGMHDAQPCACTTVTLGAEQLAALRREFSGCLCLDCLRELTAGSTPELPVPAATTPAP
jgi:hypothetical protein